LESQHKSLLLLNFVEVPLDNDDLIALAYDAANEPDGWQAFMEETVKRYESDAGDFVTERAGSGTLEIVASAGYDPYFRALYEEPEIRDNPWVGKMLGIRIDGVCDSDDGRVPFSGLRKTAFYNDWLKPQGLRHGMSAVLRLQHPEMTFFGVLRGARGGPFDETTIRHFDVLLGHVKRAHRLQRILGNEREMARGALTALDLLETPVYLLDAAGRVLHHNAAAETCIEQANALLCRSDRTLSTSNHEAAVSLGAAIRRAANPMALGPEPVSLVRIPRRDRREACALVTPLRNRLDGAETSCWRIAVFLLDPERALNDRHEILKASFSLTPTETQVALHMARGGNLEDFAARNEISLSTARWHLKNVQSKTFTRRQGELVHLLNSLLGM
jgi:DNA-binding CsgD family transcriptional regulator